MRHPDFDTFTPTKPFFVGIDSDGCVFDSMELKHKECFCPQTIKHWGLQGVSKYAREVWDFVNLYSHGRGLNRWPALIRALDLLRERDEVKSRQVAVPTVPRLRRWIEEESQLGLPALRKLVAEEDSDELRQAAAWCEGIDEAVRDMVHDVPPFPGVRASLEALADKADIVVVSQTPAEALRREWAEHGLDQYVQLICGQEMGTKAEHLQYAASKHYAPNRILMLGDALGDHAAAVANGVRFYPIVPGQEETSWKRFHLEIIDLFLAGDYNDAHEKAQLTLFTNALDDTPPWQRDV